MKLPYYTLLTFFFLTSCQAQDISKKIELKALSNQFQKSFNDSEFELLHDFFNLKMKEVQSILYEINYDLESLQ
jgi:hypothetical protein